uniref:Nudix hydrolase domain-containing protein n=1 Tax=Megaselia scalaris TaxID=36166 RepID=T1H691_MEGSC
IEDKLNRVFRIQDLDDITSEVCDFSLEEQNAATEAQGIQPSTSSDYVPVIGKSVTYVVVCVLINDQNEVLMMQESKPSCAGKWYLPAGRMESGEHICEAAAREVLEETGIETEMTTLLGIEAAGGSWFRFILTGKVLGGTLKTPDQADRESMQAKWIGDLNELTLRANDIINVIEIARSYKNKGENPWHADILPIRFSHHKSFLRVVAVARKRTSNSLNMLVSEKNVHHLPTVEIHPGRSVYSTLRKFMVELFGAELPQHRPHGVLTLEHNPSAPPHTTDGICVTLLVAFRPPVEECNIIGKCIWHELKKALESKLVNILSNKNLT